MASEAGNNDHVDEIVKLDETVDADAQPATNEETEVAGEAEKKGMSSTSADVVELPASTSDAITPGNTEKSAGWEECLIDFCLVLNVCPQS